VVEVYVRHQREVDGPRKLTQAVRRVDPGYGETQQIASQRREQPHGVHGFAVRRPEGALPHGLDRDGGVSPDDQPSGVHNRGPAAWHLLLRSHHPMADIRKTMTKRATVSMRPRTMM